MQMRAHVEGLLLVVGLLAFGLAAGIAAPETNQFPLLISVQFKASEFPSPNPFIDEPADMSEDRASRAQADAVSGGSEVGPGVAGRLERAAIPPGREAVAPRWINSSPLTMARLRGKVVLIDFWEYTCINCIRTFATNKKWHDRYQKYGFEIIGVHDPEFDIAYSADHVRAAVRRFGLPYPVVVDSGFKIWNLYHNSSWPNRFLIDASGFARFNRAGEGGDSDFERAIQMLLAEAHPGVKFPPEYTIPPEENAVAPSCGIPTQEMYIGDWYGRGALANPEGYHPGKTIEYRLPGEINDSQATVSGPWQTDKNGMIYRGKRKSAPSSDRLEMRYHARELYSVMSVSHGRPSRVYIQQDGKDLTAENKGVDVGIENSRSYIEIREPRMYYLVQNLSFGQHTVTLIPTAPGLTINSFTFGNNCQTDFPHL